LILCVVQAWPELADCALAKVEQEVHRHTQLPRQVSDNGIIGRFLAFSTSDRLFFVLVFRCWCGRILVKADRDVWHLGMRRYFGIIHPAFAPVTAFATPTSSRWRRVIFMNWSTVRSAFLKTWCLWLFVIQSVDTSRRKTKTGGLQQGGGSLFTEEIFLFTLHPADITSSKLCFWYDGMFCWIVPHSAEVLRPSCGCQVKSKNSFRGNPHSSLSHGLAKESLGSSSPLRDAGPYRAGVGSDCVRPILR